MKFVEDMDINDEMRTLNRKDFENNTPGGYSTGSIIPLNQ